MSAPIFVTSDSHLGHANIRTYIPWRATWSNDIHEHDAKLIESWNQTVGPHDHILHCGDFCFGPPENVTRYLDRLNGFMTLVVGNHDKSVKRMMQLGVRAACTRMEFELHGLGWVYAIHDPAGLQAVDCSKYVAILHGHHHGDNHRGSLEKHFEPATLAKLIDCGVDALKSRRPVRITDLIRKHLER